MDFLFTLLQLACGPWYLPCLFFSSFVFFSFLVSESDLELGRVLEAAFAILSYLGRSFRRFSCVAFYLKLKYYTLVQPFVY